VKKSSLFIPTIALLAVLALSLLPAASTRADTTRLDVPLCADFDGATNDNVRAAVPAEVLEKGMVYCRVIALNGEFVPGASAAEIGNQDVLDQGVVHAIDVFALEHGGEPHPFFNADVTVCLKGDGMMLYLDATVAPRSLMALSAYRDGGYTCATISNAGTVVLTGRPAEDTGDEEDPDAEPGDGDTAAPVSVDTTSGKPLEDCSVTTRDILNLRAEPRLGSTVIKLVPYNVTLKADAIKGSWYRVTYLGSIGWVSAQYVNASLSCD
jgi:hypothetical protein